MRIFLTALLLALQTAAITAFGQNNSNENPYQQPLQLARYQTEAIVLPARTIGTNVLRKQDVLGVMVRVDILNHFPRDLELVLMLDDREVGYPAGVLGVQGNVTTFGFVVEDTALIKNNAVVAVQVGHETETRARFEQRLQRKSVTPLGDEQAGKYNLPQNIPDD